MNKSLPKLFFFCVFIVFTLASSAIRANDERAKLLIGDITKIYMSSMVYIFVNQPLINGSSTDKSALQGDKFIQNIKEVYFAKYSEPFPETDHFVKKALLETMVEVMADNELLLADNDIEFKGLIPATFAFQLSAKLSTKGVGLKIKFTRTRDSIRNQLNMPDDWEGTVMEQIKVKPEIFYDNSALINGKPAFRQFTPLPMAKYCLNCHGHPKDNPMNLSKEPSDWTDIDVTGFKMEGWKLQDFGGGVSISIEKSVLER